MSNLELTALRLVASCGRIVSVASCGGASFWTGTPNGLSGFDWHSERFRVAYWHSDRFIGVG